MNIQVERNNPMRTKMTIVTSVAVLALILFTGVVSAKGEGVSLAKGFNGPMGVLVAPDGSVWVIDSGMGGATEMPFKDPETGKDTTVKLGDTARVVQIGADGKQSVAATLPSILNGQEASGGNRLAVLNGALYATNGAWLEAAGLQRLPNTAAIVKIEGGKATEVANTWDLENSQNPGGYVKEAHPYGLAAGPDGKLWVADAGANDLLRVDPASGKVELVASFAGVPGPLPNPSRGGAQESDPVPTGIAFDASGNAYVSFLPGFPFAPGSAKVVKVTADGKVSDYATGLTMLTDLRTGPDGALYAVQIGQFTEQGPVPDSGAIIRVKPGGASEVVASGLSFPTSIAFNAAGDAYVTINGLGAPGSGEVLQFAKLTSQAGTTLAPPTLPTTGGEPVFGGWIAVASLALGFGLLAAGFALRRRSLA
jgi:sugar lactone lactonase YvrE